MLDLLCPFSWVTLANEITVSQIQILAKTLNSVANDKILELSTLEQYVGKKLIVAQMVNISLYNGGKHCGGKGENSAKQCFFSSQNAFKILIPEGH